MSTPTSALELAVAFGVIEGALKEVATQSGVVAALSDLGSIEARLKRARQVVVVVEDPDPAFIDDE